MILLRGAESQGKDLRHILNISDWVRAAAAGTTDKDPIGLGRVECWVREPTDINHM